MTGNPYATHAVLARMNCDRAVRRGDLTPGEAYALVALECLLAAGDAATAGDAHVAHQLLDEAARQARLHRAHRDLATFEVPDTPAGLLGATESEQNPPPVPEVPLDQNEEPERD